MEKATLIFEDWVFTVPYDADQRAALAPGASVYVTWIVDGVTYAGTLQQVST